MSELIDTLESDTLDHLSLHPSQHTIGLESGRVLYLPQLCFDMHHSELFQANICDPKKKNISYQYLNQTLSGLSSAQKHQHAALQSMMHRYAEYAQKLVHTACPEYQSALRWGRTSYRPVEIVGRHRSKRQDDTRLHVDAFPSTPVQGWRILRVFCNVNQKNQPRIWHLGESFANLLPQFAPTFPTYHPFKAWLLHRLKITKTRRTIYDHEMLHLHDQMKLSDTYQNQVQKTQMAFAAQSTWVVFTDLVSHAALSGQYLLEQTFYVPISAMVKPDRAPFKQLERYRAIKS